MVSHFRTNRNGFFWTARVENIIDSRETEELGSIALAENKVCVIVSFLLRIQKKANIPVKHLQVVSCIPYAII